jgi:hypothetical protein
MQKKCRSTQSENQGLQNLSEAALAYHVPQWNCCFRAFGILKIPYFQTHPDKANVSKFPDTKTWQFQHWKFSCRPNVRCVPMTVKENLHERRISNEHGWTNRTQHSHIRIYVYVYYMYIICILYVYDLKNRLLYISFFSTSLLITNHKPTESPTKGLVSWRKRWKCLSGATSIEDFAEKINWGLYWPSAYRGGFWWQNSQTATGKHGSYMDCVCIYNWSINIKINMCIHVYI